MRKIKTLLLVGLAFWYAAEGFAQRGIGTNLPDRSSVLHLESGTRGLLIPQINLTNGTLDPAPVINPANSLLIYNTATIGDVGEDEIGVRPGYYYWKYNDPDDKTLGGQWIPLLNTAGNNIEIDDNGVVSVKPGEYPGDVLVTTVDDSDPDELIYSTKWMSFEDFIKVIGENGVTVVPETDPDTGITTYTVELGGTLYRTTEIITEGKKFEIRTSSLDADGEPTNTDGDNFFITNLNEIKVNDDGTIGTDPNDPFFEDIFKNTFDVLIVNKDTGLVQRVSVQDLLKDAIDAENGLTYGNDNVIRLGGKLNQEETTITLDGNDFIIDASPNMDDADNPGESNFKVIGLEEVEAANQIMVVDANDNVRTVRRVISHVITSTTTIDVDFSDYSPYVHEVNIKVKDLRDDDMNLFLPAATAANEGQVINVRLDITTESPNYFMIKTIGVTDDEDSITWGALPFQGWTLKVINGEWLVVSSN